MKTRIHNSLLIATAAAALCAPSGAWAGLNGRMLERLHDRGDDAGRNHQQSQQPSQPQSQPQQQRQPSARQPSHQPMPSQAREPATRYYRSPPTQVAPSPGLPNGDRGARGNERGTRGSDRGVMGDLLARQRGGNDYQGDHHGGNGGNQHWNRQPNIIGNLPYGYRDHYWNGGHYYNHGGHWYRPHGSSYISIGVPYGLFVSYLPSYYNSFWYGNDRYYYADDTYYMYEPTRRGYVVSRSPYEDSRDDSYGSNAQDEDLYVYPSRGQSEQQQSDDRYECHRWAVRETGFDPIDADYDADRRADYLRAITACLTGRGYSVR
jgi:hypothetical protein